MKRIVWTLGALLFALLFMLCACGEAPSQQASPADDSAVEQTADASEEVIADHPDDSGHADEGEAEAKGEEPTAEELTGPIGTRQIAVRFYPGKQGEVDSVEDRDENGLLIRKFRGMLIELPFDSDHSDYEYYEYDNAGNLLKISYHLMDGEAYTKAVYEYDDAGHLTCYTSFDSEGNIFERTDVETDANGNLILESYYIYGGDYDASGELVNWTQYEYNEKGELVHRHTSSYENNVVNGKAVTQVRDDYPYDYEYDEEGRLVRMTFLVFTQGEVLPGENVYEYDVYGNLSELKVYRDGALYAWNEYEYNEEGQCLKLTRYNTDGEIQWWIEYLYETVSLAELD